MQEQVKEKIINELNVDKLNQFVDDLKTKPDVVKSINGPWHSRVKWQGGLKAKAYMRNH